MTKKNLISSGLAMTLLALTFCACKKSEVNGVASNNRINTIANNPGHNYGPNVFEVYYSYVTTAANPTSRLAAYRPTQNTNTFIQDFSGGISNPSFQAYMGETDELIGTLHWSNNISWNAMLKFDLTNKTTKQVDFYTPEQGNGGADETVNQIVKLDEEKKQIYYLEGEAGQIGFKTLTRCNYDGSAKVVLINSANHDMMQAVVADGTVYFVSRAHNALMKLLPNKQIITVIKNLNLAGASIVDYIKVDYNNKHLVKMKQPVVDQRRMCLLAIDPTLNKIFWIRNSHMLIDGQEQGNLYDKVRPSLVCAKLDGKDFTTIIPYTQFFNGDKAPSTNDNKRYTLQRGNLIINSSAARIYVAYEVLEHNPTKSYNGQGLDYAYLKTNLSMWECRTNGDYLKFTIEPNKTNFQNPANWKNAKVYFSSFPNNVIPANHPVYQGSLESFIATKDNDIF